MRRGFTLLELCFVITLIGLLAAVTVPAYDVVHRRALALEAPTMLEAISNAEM